MTTPLPPVPAFDVPKPPAPGPSEPGRIDWNGWDINMRWHALNEQNIKAARREFWDSEIVRVNALLADSNNALASAMKEYAAKMVEAAEIDARVVPPTDAQILLDFFQAALASGENGAQLTSDAVAALKAYRTASKTA